MSSILPKQIMEVSDPHVTTPLGRRRSARFLGQCTLVEREKLRIFATPKPKLKVNDTKVRTHTVSTLGASPFPISNFKHQVYPRRHPGDLLSDRSRPGLSYPGPGGEPRGLVRVPKRPKPPGPRSSPSRPRCSEAGGAQPSPAVGDGSCAGPARRGRRAPGGQGGQRSRSVGREQKRQAAPSARPARQRGPASLPAGAAGPTARPTAARPPPSSSAGCSGSGLPALALPARPRGAFHRLPARPHFPFLFRPRPARSRDAAGSAGGGGAPGGAALGEPGGPGAARPRPGASVPRCLRVLSLRLAGGPWLSACRGIHPTAPNVSGADGLAKTPQSPHKWEETRLPRVSRHKANRVFRLGAALAEPREGGVVRIAGCRPWEQQVPETAKYDLQHKIEEVALSALKKTQTNKLISEMSSRFQNIRRAVMHQM